MNDASHAALVLDSRCTHGEGLLWCDRRQCLFWVDISACRVWRYSPVTGQSHAWSVPDRPGCLGLLDDGRLLVVLAKSVCVADPDATSSQLALEVLTQFEAEQPLTRSNDGRADRHGRFVFGTMDEHAQKAGRGAFYQFSLRHGLRPLALGEVSIPNAICFSPDGRTLYFCDSVTPRILCCDYASDSAGVSNVRVFAQLDQPGAEPDGAIVDAQGGVWNAQWRAWQVVRYGVDGQVDRVLPLPVMHPTCPALGGAALDRLYVVSSQLDHTEQARARGPLAGGLFAAQVDIAGLPEGRVYA
ncbi:SMP-30/gluconolactonase/LRE family protein [Pseudoxanthomonas sp.]|uniref:SMP-30/gluconolactonase/LRE family protein n=1 Tax=Pseudoxanthomonas sp. TaxID=1871049 RepID=UPI002610E9F9|nr:SMP-30/gluconolactonase/LRE family protein [Pseudoxanthomonas sp.]WDS36188.1 MAG: SMP-30/gluconolactonase/LRE family protein [Pseudoxanthomonas sp.]